MSKHSKDSLTLLDNILNCIPEFSALYARRYVYRSIIILF